jgi:hypothetical protein
MKMAPQQQLRGHEQTGKHDSIVKQTGYPIGKENE